MCRSASLSPSTTLILGFWRTRKTRVGSLLCLQNALSRKALSEPVAGHCMHKCLCVWDWGRADAASRCNDDEAVFVVVAVLVLAASWSGLAAAVSGDTQVRGITERAE